jgi:hypothetical protein
MNIEGVPFGVTDWNALPATTHPGSTGFALWRTLQLGDIRVRLVTYSPGYVADHWCERGHILFVVEGTLVTELREGATHTLTAGMSYQVSSGLPPHRSSSPTGARAFIVD